MKTNKVLYFLISWLPVILLCSAIFYVSSFPTVRTTTIHWQDFGMKKLAHIIEYAALTVLTFRALFRSGVPKHTAAVWAILFAFSYGASDEFHQRFVTGRESHFRDVIIDTFGSTLAILAVWKLLPKAPRPLKNLAKSLDLY